VNDELPLVTVIIPARPDQTVIHAVEAARQLDYPAGRLEILVARGTQPSAQRNAALQAAHGEFIYFLDDDSIPPPDMLKRGLAHFAQPEVQMAGGPNLCPVEAPFLEQVFARVMVSPLAFGGSVARYGGKGTVRASSEKELILCNLLARRASLLAAGGFDEKLYPGEENVLMDELQKRGGRLIYDPDLIVYRRPRSTLKAFCKMLFHYGRSRSELFRLHPTMNSALNFAPPLFCLYLLLLPAMPLFMLWPLGLYGSAVLLQGIALLITRKRPVITLIALPLLVLTHLLYGLGFWRGLFTRPSPPPPSVRQSIPLEFVQSIR
jgi:cellulose synthase/poly-beta-1,6-N-acetylglucosamine synthase-like glycosyltransferase